ncbi:unnamed protein product, partial [Prorocentrum cordatum]
DLDMDTSAVQDEFVADLKRVMWGVASKHLHGDDLCEGADATVIVRKQQHYRSNGQMDMYAQSIVVTSGGQWPRVRQRDAGYELESVTCPRCGHEDETLYHRIWTCPANRGCKEYDSTSHLAAQATAQHESQPSLWLRGLPALRLTTPLYDEDFTEWSFEVGDFRRARGHQGAAEISVVWIPSHMDEQAHLLVSPSVIFRAAGNACADALAGVAAQEALSRGLVGDAPHTDVWDTIAAQVRTRARKALIDTLEVDAWEASRIEEAAESSCTPVPAPRVGGGVGVPSSTVECNSYSILGNQVVHPSHALFLWQEHILFFCNVCGSTATLKLVGLAVPCRCPTKRGQQNLTRIKQGKVPSYAGLPKGAKDASLIVQSGVGAAPEGSNEGPPESSDEGSNEGPPECS